MEICFKGTKIFYDVVGEGETTLFLCGWGYGSEVIRPLASKVRGKKIFIDFPMFGKSGKLEEDWLVQDYAELVLAVLQREKIKKSQILGHSFGGKVAILLAGKYNICKRLVLLCSAGVKPRFSLRRMLEVRKYKRAKKRGDSIEGFGSDDWRALPQNAKKTFVRIVNTHVLDVAKNISVPTLLVAGRSDEDTPLYMQKKLKRAIRGSRLVVYGGHHFVWLSDFQGVTDEVAKFLNEEET